MSAVVGPASRGRRARCVGHIASLESRGEVWCALSIQRARYMFLQLTSMIILCTDGKIRSTFTKCSCVIPEGGMPKRPSDALGIEHCRMDTMSAGSCGVTGELKRTIWGNCRSMRRNKTPDWKQHRDWHKLIARGCTILQVHGLIEVVNLPIENWLSSELQPERA